MKKLRPGRKIDLIKATIAGYDQVKSIPSSYKFSTSAITYCHKFSSLKHYLLSHSFEGQKFNSGLTKLKLKYQQICVPYLGVMGKKSATKYPVSSIVPTELRSPVQG